MERLLKRARKVAQEAEIYRVTSRDTPVIFEANRLKMLESRESEGVALRLVKDGRIGFASTSNMKELDRLVDMALEMAPFGPVAQFTLPEPLPYPDVPVFDADVEGLPTELLIELGTRLVDGVRERYTEVQCDARVGKSITEVQLLNSRGFQASCRRSVVWAGLEGTWIRGTDMLFVGEHQSSCHPIADLDFITNSTLEQLDMSVETAPAPAGDVPVLFTPSAVAGVLIRPLVIALNGRSVLQKSSPLADRLGDKVLDEGISLLDDPTVPFVPGSRPWDDEGLASQRTTLVDKGVIAHFLYDLQTAAQAKTRSTASASRSLSSLPSPSVSVLFLKEGDVPYQELLGDIKEGLLVEKLLGAGQSNITGGDFSANVLLGHRIEKGRVVGRVKNTVISGNVYKVLKDVIGLSQEGRWIGGYLHTPAVCCRGVTVASGG